MDLDFNLRMDVGLVLFVHFRYRIDLNGFLHFELFPECKVIFYGNQAMFLGGGFDVGGVPERFR